LTNYLASADFSGDLATSVVAANQAATTSSYQAIPGVITASVGFIGTGIGGTGDLPMDVRAVDTTNFAQTVIWPSLAAAQTGNALLKRLADLSRSPLPGDVVPAIVDTITMNKLRLHVGSLFLVTVDKYETAPMDCLIIGFVPQIPTITDVTSFDSEGATLSGGVLVDYKNYITAFTDQVHDNLHLGKLDPPPLNHVWLHTRDDAAFSHSLQNKMKRDCLPMRQSHRRTKESHTSPFVRLHCQ
jgi:hypothetical protein